MALQDSVILNIDNVERIIPIESFIRLKDPVFNVDETFDDKNNNYIEFYCSDNYKMFMQIDTSEREQEEINGKRIILYNDYFEGYNYIEVSHNGKKYTKYFYVNPPKALKESSVTKIREIVDKISPGLSIDYNDKSVENIIVANHYRNCDKIKINYLINNYQKILNVLREIKNKPIESLERIVHKSGAYKKQNAKTINLAIKHYEESKYYNQKQVVDNNNEENSMLYFSLLYIKKYINRIFNNIEKDVNDLSQDIKKLSRYKKNQYYYESIKTSYEEKINVYNTYNKKFLGLLKQIDDTIYSLELNGLSISSRRITPKLLKNHNYSYLIDIYKLISSDYIDFVLEKGLINRTVSFKRTPVLFELYTYCLIKDILIENNYKYSSVDEDKKSFQVRFYNDSYYYDVIYNNDATYIDDVKESDDVGAIYIEERSSEKSVRSTPDFVVLKYDNDNNLIKSIIIEVKCRRPRNVKSFDVLKQLRGYTQLKTLNKKINKINSFDKILCVYPYSEEEYNRIEEKPYEYIYYISLEIKEDFNRDKGYNYLKKELL